MHKYAVRVEEVVTEDFEICADTLEDALALGRKMYCDGKLVVGSGNAWSETNICAMNTDRNVFTDWSEMYDKV